MKKIQTNSYCALLLMLMLGLLACTNREFKNPVDTAVALEAPVSLTARAYSDSRVKLSWQVEASAPFTGFLIEKQLGSGELHPIGTTDMDSRSFIDTTGVILDSVYTYYVSGLVDENNGEALNAEVVLDKLYGPSLLSLSFKSDEKAELKWQAATSRDEWYVVEYAPEGDDFKEIARVPGAQFSYEFNHPFCTDSTYCFRVRAVTPFNSSRWTAVQRRYILSAPQNLSFTPHSDRHCELNWQRSSQDVSYYRVELAINNGEFEAVGTLFGYETSYHYHGPLYQENFYSFRVQAQTERNASLWCSAVYHFILIPPLDLNLSFNDSNQPVFSWHDGNDVETGYLVRRGPRGGEMTDLIRLDADTETYTDINLPNGEDIEALDYEICAFSELNQSTAESKSIKSVESLRPLQTLGAGSSNVLCLDFSPDDMLLATGNEDNSVTLWNTGTWTVEHRFNNLRGAVTSVAFSPRNDILATSSDGLVEIWDLASKTLIRQIGANGGEFVDFSGTGEYLAIGNSVGRIYVYNVDDWTLCQDSYIEMLYGLSKMQFAGNAHEIRCMTNGRYIYIIKGRLFDQLYRWGTGDITIKDFECSSDGYHMLVSWENELNWSRLGCFPLMSQTASWYFQERGADADLVTTSFDHDLVATWCWDEKLYLFSHYCSVNSTLEYISPAIPGVTDMVFSPQGSFLVLGCSGGDAALHVWEGRLSNYLWQEDFSR